ncbi:MAG: hypothetical protein HQL97_00360 [Magnetococcales bacterium]|nr:hypothetical protein [Magnetococcales bacterium]
MGLLALAGVVSGMGDGLGKAAATAGTFLSASALQEQREKMELRRMELMEGNAAAREQRGYAHSEKLATDAQANARAMQRETIAHADRSQDKTLAHADTTLDRTQGFTREENDKTRGEHKADRSQAMEIANLTLAQGDERLKADKEHHAATIKIAQAQIDAAKEKSTLMPMSDGTIYRVNAQGEVVGKALDPDTGKPLAGTKDLPATTKLLVEVNKVMIQQKGEQLKNTSLLPEERSVINAEMTRLKGDIETLLGRAPVKSGATQIIDPAATITAPDTLTAKGGPAKPAPGADEYLAQKRQEADQRTAALKGATQQAGQAAMDAENPGAVASTAPMPEQAPPSTPAAPPQVAKMERQRPTMQQPGEPSPPSGLMAAAARPPQPPPPAPPQTAALPRELPRAAAPPPAVAGKPPMAEPDIIDPNGPPDPLATDKPATLPRELERAAPPSGLLAASKKPIAEPPMTDPDGPPVDRPAGLKPAANPTGKQLTQSDLIKLLTIEQKEKIVDMQKRVRSDGVKVQPATEQRFRSLLIEIYGPILQKSGYTPAELVENIDSLMDTMLPERTKRKDRK